LSYSGTNYGGISQRIESLNCTDLSGATVTVSFWMKSISGSTAIALALYYPSAQDNYTTQTTINTSYFSNTTSWAQYSFTFTGLPSGVTNGLMMTVLGASGSATGFEITGVQLEKGGNATSFDYRPYGTELNLCYRYYWQLPAANTSEVFGYCYSTNSSVIYFPFPVPMRVPPSSLTTTAANWTGFTATNSGSTVSSFTWNTAGYQSASVVVAFTATAGTPTRISSGASGTIGFNGAEL
jgi:hypothetical protein